MLTIFVGQRRERRNRPQSSILETFSRSFYWQRIIYAISLFMKWKHKAKLQYTLKNQKILKCGYVTTTKAQINTSPYVKYSISLSYVCHVNV